MHFVKHGFQALLESLVLNALVKLADEVSANFECVVAESEGCSAEVLQTQCADLSAKCGSVQ